MSVRLHFDHHVADVPVGRSLFDCGEALGVRVPTSCRKAGRCKECVVEVCQGAELLEARTDEERHLRGSFRLACQARISAEAGEVRCQTMRRGEMQIETSGAHLPGLERSWVLDPAVRREGDRILLEGTEIARGAGPLLGLALDIGTTTVVVRLVDLETGSVFADTSFENPQRFAGSDVMSRIAYDNDDSSHVLQRTLAGYLSHAIAGFGVNPRSIYEVAVVGNSTMRDLFFRLPVTSIGLSPYESITQDEVTRGVRDTTSLKISAERLGLPVHPRARVYGLPIIAGHVGADAAACMLAVDMAHEDRLVAVMDIGTNTELIVGHKKRLLAASCPAGPAFEGGLVRFGMPALPGAIESTRISADGLVSYGVIGTGPAEGICGSGMVDILSELRRTRRMSRMGRFAAKQSEFVIQQDAERPISLSEADVNALAQAKAANAAGLQIVFEQFGARYSDVDVLYLAGGFGRHLNLDSAKRIGLIPNIPNRAIVQIGNAAIEGASIALLSLQKRRELEQLVRRVEHCRLETHPKFFDLFAEGCQFSRIRERVRAKR